VKEQRRQKAERLQPIDLEEAVQWPRHSPIKDPLPYFQPVSPERAVLSLPSPGVMVERGRRAITNIGAAMLSSRRLRTKSDMV